MDVSKLILSARNAQQKNDKEKAIALYSEIIKLDPDSREAKEAKAELRFLIKTKPHKNEEVLKTKEINPENVSSFNSNLNKHEKNINNEPFEVITRQETDEAIVEVVAYKKLRGSSDPRTAETLFFATQAGMRLKMVRIHLKNSSIRVEPGALYHMVGNLEIKSSTGGGLLKGLARKVTSGESFFVNEIHGTGTIFLEPTFGHFVLHKIHDGDNGIICDKGMFYAGSNKLDIGAAMQKNISSGLLGGEGWWQTSITGVGVAVLFSPVPVEEITEITLNNEKLSVDGNFALMRTKGVEFRAEKSSKSWIATSVSGEGLLQTFRGSGKVWIAPTQGVYERMTTLEGLHSLAYPPGSKGTMTDINKPEK